MSLNATKKLTPRGEKISFFEFPNRPLLRKKWIQAIRREKEKDWRITLDSKLCSNKSCSLDEIIVWTDVYRQDLLGLFHPQGKEEHHLKGCLCRFFCLRATRKPKKHLFRSDAASEITIPSAESPNEIFSLDRFKSDADVNFYTGLPNYATLICIFESWWEL